MARKLRGFERVLDAPSLFAVAYGEIASSLYIALGIVAATALGLTPLVLLVAGCGLRPRLALVRGGHRRAPGDRRRRDLRAARVQRPRRVRDGLGALPRLPHRHGALGALRPPLPRRRDRPGVAARVAVGRGRRLRAHRRDRGSARRSPDAPPPRRRSRSRCSTCSCRASSCSSGSRSCSRPRRSARASASRAARTGATSRSRSRWRCSRTPGSRPSRTSQRRRPSRVARCRARSSPRSGSSCVVTVLIGAIGLSAYPVTNGETALGEEWLEAPLVGIAAAFDGSLPSAPRRRRSRSRSGSRAC